MSVVVQAWVWTHSPVSESGQRLVLLYLADCASDDGTGAWPSVKTIAKACRMSERNVQYCLRALQTSHHIKKVGTSQHGTYVYDIEMGGANLAGVQDTAPKASSSTTTHDVVEALGAAHCSPVQPLAPLGVTEEQQEVIDILNDVAETHRINKPKIELVLKTLRDFKDLDAVAEARAFERFWTDNPPRRMKSTTASFGKWLAQRRKWNSEGNKGQAWEQETKAAFESLMRGET